MATENGFFTNQTQFQNDPKVSQRDNLKGFYGVAVRPAYIEDLVAKAEEAAAKSYDYSQDSKQYRDEAEVIRDQTQAINDQTEQVYNDTVQVYNNTVVQAANAANSAAAAAQSESNAASSETSAANSAVIAAGFAADAEAAFDNFNDQYLGAKPVDPTTDNDGNPLQVGATYWNSTTHDLRFWNGATWDNPEQTATQAANTAVAASDSAQVSATNAANSESTAATSEANALASENAAATSASNAATSESDAATSAGNASTSEANAAQSAADAQQSADDAAAIVPSLQSQIDTLDGEVVKTSGDQTISGIKKFNQDILASSISSALGVDQGLLFFSSGSTRLGGTGSAAGIQLRPNGRNVEDDTDYFNFKPNGTVEYAGTSNFSISRLGGQHGVFAYEDGRTFLTGGGGNIELSPRGLSDASKGLSMSSTGTTIHSHSGGAFLSFRDAVNDGTNSSSYMQWMHSDNTRRGFLGYGSSANNNMTWFNDEGNNAIVLKEDGNVQVNAELTIFNTEELRVESTGATKLDLYHSNGDSNVNIRFGSNTGTDIYFGKTNSTFAMGASQNLSATGNQWVQFSGYNTIFRNPVYLPSSNPTASNMAARKAYVDSVASDRNLKSEITPVENALNIVNSLPVYTYQKDVLERNEETETDEVVKQFEYGFVAQDVETILPHLILTGQDGMKNISRKGNDFHAIAFKAIQELSEENKQLKDRLAAIEAHLGLGE